MQDQERLQYYRGRLRQTNEQAATVDDPKSRQFYHELAKAYAQIIASHEHAN